MRRLPTLLRRFPVRRLLAFGGSAQFVLSVLGAVGLNLAAALAVLKLLTPVSAWGYLLALAVFLALTPITFPVAAVALNWGLAKVELSRRKVIFDSPTETARKICGELLVDAKRLQASLPTVAWQSPNEHSYQAQRFTHFLMNADATLARASGEYAAYWFSVDDRPDAWRRLRVAAPEDYRGGYGRAIASLESMRDVLPINRTKWLKRSLSIDITAGRSLAAFLRAGVGGDAGYGSAELAAWAEAVKGSTDRDGLDFGHLFAPETCNGLADAEARAVYVEERLTELERQWRAL